jgi:hypothetical protein
LRETTGQVERRGIGQGARFSDKCNVNVFNSGTRGTSGETQTEEQNNSYRVNVTDNFAL